jgi:dienelactone hydrolase
MMLNQQERYQTGDCVSKRGAMTLTESYGNGPTIAVTPASGMIDEPLHVVVRGLPPGVAATVKALLVDTHDVRWSSHATCIADDDGSVDLNSQAPVSGTYDGPDGEGLISSLAVEGQLSTCPFDGSSIAPLCVEFAVEVNGQPVARAQARRLYVADGVRTATVSERGLSGQFFEREGDEPRPGILVLGGSSGKLAFAAQVAALLAGRGFPSLALAYFGLDGLPPHLTEIPIAYFSTAIDWLESQPAVRADALGIVGRSRGAELALLLGSRFSCIRAAIAYCPSSLLWNGLRGDVPVDLPAWREADRPIPFVSLMRPALSEVRGRILQASPVTLSPLFGAALDRPVPVDAVIPVETINGPMLLISGEDDRMWPSARMGDQIMARLNAHGHPFDSRHCRYPGAGHLMRTPGVPTSTLENRFAFGGYPSAQAAANRAAWSESLSFLHASLDVRLAPDTAVAVGGSR